MQFTIPGHFPFSFPSFIFKKTKNPFDNIHSLNELHHLLTSDQCDMAQWNKWKNEIHAVVQNHVADLDDLDKFLKRLTEWGMKHDPQKLTSAITDVVSFEILDELVRYTQSSSKIAYENVFDWAAEHSEFCPFEENKFENRISAEWRKYRPSLISSIPNIINIFLGAFNFLDIRKKYTTLWEKHLVLEIVCKFFFLPYVIYKVLEPFIEVTMRVYLATALIIVGIGVLVSIYQRWLRPLPDEIVNCTNLDKLWECGAIDSTVCQTKEIEKLKAALQGGSNVLLIGRSGEGKTAMVHHLVEIKHKEKLPEKLQKLAFFEVDCGLMISSVSYGYSELITQIKEGCDGYENQILLFFDEFFQIATNKAAFIAFKKRFLEDKPQSKFVATISLAEYKKLLEVDEDGSFHRRVVPIIVQASSKEHKKHNQLIAQKYVQQKAKDLRVTDDAIKKALSLSKKVDFMPNIGQPAKVVKLLEDAIGTCRSAFEPHYKSEELKEAQQEYQTMRLQAARDVKVSDVALTALRQKKADLEKKEKELEQHKTRAKKIQTDIQLERALHGVYSRLAHQLARVVVGDSSKKPEDPILDDLAPQKKQKQMPLSKDAVKKEDQATFLWIYFYAIDAMKKMIDSEIEKVRKDLPVQVDKALIKTVYEQSKQIDQKLTKVESKKTEIKNPESPKQNAVTQPVDDAIYAK